MTEQELILTSVLQCRRVDLYTDTLDLSCEQKRQLEHIEGRRKCHEPIQYILNTAEFMGLDFYVDQNVLIPRPETELLVEAAERFLRSSVKPLSILDVGTGSGNIVISLAKQFSQHQFLAVDVSPQALAVAQRNAAAHHVLTRIEFLQDDILSCNALLRQEKKFDIIISNPPYIPSGEIAQLQAEVLHEPFGALDGGEDGLRFYRAIAQLAKNFLKPQGMIFFEIGKGQRDSIQRILEQDAHICVKECLKDYSQVERIIIAQRI